MNITSQPQKFIFYSDSGLYQIEMGNTYVLTDVDNIGRISFLRTVYFNNEPYILDKYDVMKDVVYYKKTVNDPKLAKKEQNEF